MTVYALLYGARYTVSAVVALFATVEGAVSYVATQFPDYLLQDPPANGYSHSWLNSEMNSLSLQSF